MDGLYDIISIHAPRVGGDAEVCVLTVWLSISIHAPRVGGDDARIQSLQPFVKFQSTPPVWGATDAYLLIISKRGDFNPRPPCGGRQYLICFLSDCFAISIHAPRVGGDGNGVLNGLGALSFQSTPPVWGATRGLAFTVSGYTFQSTPPVWGATCPPLLRASSLKISIHAPRVGGDVRVQRL